MRADALPALIYEDPEQRERERERERDGGERERQSGAAINQNSISTF